MYSVNRMEIRISHNEKFQNGVDENYEENNRLRLYSNRIISIVHSFSFISLKESTFKL